MNKSRAQAHHNTRLQLPRKHGHGKIANVLVSDTYPTQTQACQERKLFYFDVKCCLFELFLWVFRLFELFCSYFRQYFLIFKLILDIFPNFLLLLHTF